MARGSRRDITGSHARAGARSGIAALTRADGARRYGVLSPPLLHLKRASGESRFPLYDEIESARGLVDASGAVTDTYDIDTL